MYVCGACHRGVCSGSHVLVSFGPCELCRKETELVDCVAGHPVTAEEIRKREESRESFRKVNRMMYRHTELLEYPRKKS